MDPALLEIFKQAPWAAMILYLWQKTAEERREWRAWFESQQKEIAKVIEANTQALIVNSGTLGEANAARFSCPATGRLDERGEPFRRRKANGHSADGDEL